MSKGLKALKSLEKIFSDLYGLDIAYDDKTFKLFRDIGKELKLLDFILESLVSMSNTKVIMGDYYEVVIALDQDEYDLLKEVLYG